MAGNRFDFLEIGEGMEFVPVHSIPSLPEVTEDRGGLSPDSVEWPAYNPSADQVAMPNAYFDVALRSATEESSVEEVLGSTFRPGDSGLRVVEVLGEPGNKAGQFNFPTGIAVDPTGILYIADSYNHRVQRITPAADVAIIGCRGGGRGQFQSPQGIATDSRQSIYVVEQGSHRVQKFSVNGTIELVFGRIGTRFGEFRSPSGIAVAPSTGHIYVADTGNARIQRFDVDGRYIGSLGMPGTTSQPLTSPTSIVVDALDNVFVSDLKTNRIVRFDPAGRQAGSYYAIRPRDGSMAPRILNEPRSIALDPTGLLYVADGGSVSPGKAVGGRVQVVDAATGADIICLEDVGHRLGSFARPGGIAVAAATASHLGPPTRGDLFVSDTLNHRILRFTWK